MRESGASNLIRHPDQLKLPLKIDDFKNHPVYVLERHLLKYDGIYPPDAKVITEFRGSKVYLRKNVVKLHSAQTWLKEAREIRSGEEPYKTVLGRISQSAYRRGERQRPSLALFGEWQTEPYQPPIAQDGIVPKNAFGNVDMFKPEMLPLNCVHLQQKDLYFLGSFRILKKLKMIAALVKGILFMLRS
ncbi:hypothetical protein ACOME3_000172 [Neoechinorhynchus agilis]